MCWPRVPSWRSRQGLLEQEEAEINRTCRRYAATDGRLYLAFCFSLLATQLATVACATVCVGYLWGRWRVVPSG